MDKWAFFQSLDFNHVEKLLQNLKRAVGKWVHSNLNELKSLKSLK